MSIDDAVLTIAKEILRGNFTEGNTLFVDVGETERLEFKRLLSEGLRKLCDHHWAIDFRTVGFASEWERGAIAGILKTC